MPQDQKSGSCPQPAEGRGHRHQQATVRGPAGSVEMHSRAQCSQGSETRASIHVQVQGGRAAWGRPVTCHLSRSYAPSDLGPRTEEWRVREEGPLSQRWHASGTPALAQVPRLHPRRLCACRPGEEDPSVLSESSPRTRPCPPGLKAARQPHCRQPRSPVSPPAAAFTWEGRGQSWCRVRSRLLRSVLETQVQMGTSQLHCVLESAERGAWGQASLHTHTQGPTRS